MKRAMPVALDISSDDDDEPSPSNGTKNLAGSKRPKSETTIINPTKKVETEGNFFTYLFGLPLVLLRSICTEKGKKVMSPYTFSKSFRIFRYCESSIRVVEIYFFLGCKQI